jgi:hypothetical protein
MADEGRATDWYVRTTEMGLRVQDNVDVVGARGAARGKERISIVAVTRVTPMILNDDSL